MTFYVIPETEQSRTINLYGWLTTPRGKGPFPAVILAHGCNGMFGVGPRGRFMGAWSQYQFWSKWLDSQGYATLVLESFTGRGLSQICTNGGVLPTTQRAADVYTAAAFLSKLPNIDRRKIGVIGDSHGGGTVRQAANPENYETAGAKAVLSATGGTINAFVALYPGCKGLSSTRYSAPTLVLMGAADDWTNPQECETLTNYPTVSAKPVTLTNLGAPLTIVVYPNATHAFDVNVPPVVTPAGHHLRYDPAATAHAQAQIKGFFDHYVKRATASAGVVRGR